VTIPILISETTLTQMFILLLLAIYYVEILEKNKENINKGLKFITTFPEIKIITK
jgi:hypothetical protein